MHEVKGALTGLEKKADVLQAQVGTKNHRIEVVKATVTKHDMNFNFIEERLTKKLKQDNTYKVIEKEQQEEGKSWILKDQEQEGGIHRIMEK